MADRSNLAVVQDALFGGGPEPSGRDSQEQALLHGRPLRLKYRGRPVPERRAMDACDLLTLFSTRTGHTLPRFNRDGSASESLKRVIGALTTHDDITFDHWVLTLEAVLANPWWGDGPASIGVVFGPKVVEQNLANPDHGRKTVRNGRALAVLRSVSAPA